MLSNVVGWVTRREGRKFLKLCQDIDDSVFAGAKEIGEISLYVRSAASTVTCSRKTGRDSISGT
jgi:hypothetical protein